MTLSPHTVPPRQVEIWFEFGSPYSYLSVMRIEDEAARRGVHVAWRPLLLGPIFKSLGWQGSPFLEQPLKMANMWRDLERLCDKYALPWKRPASFPRSCILPLRVLMLAQDEAWAGEFCRAMMLRHFGEDRDIDQPEVVGAVLLALGLAAADIMATARSEPVKQALRAQTERGRQLGIFGGPTFFAGAEMFWGNDRLEDALDWAASSAG
jgi:2-hydroxychromene-2-carboxylate isomerase